MNLKRRFVVIFIAITVSSVIVILILNYDAIHSIRSMYRKYSHNRLRYMLDYKQLIPSAKTSHSDSLARFAIGITTESRNHGINHIPLLLLTSFSLFSNLDVFEIGKNDSFRVLILLY